ncbi:MAG: glycosyltransferase [Rhodospirillales bacterium]|nr:glycosyltransferase [Rhodospirillales bacterium]
MRVLQQGGALQAGRGEIAVFRHNLFRISEPFITQQAQQLRRYRPLYLGRLRYGAPPAGATALALEDLGPFWPMPRIAWQMLARNPGPYLRLLGDRRPSLIHAHFGIEGVYALPLAQRLGVPLVTTFHGYDATLSTAALLTSPAWANYPLFRHRLAGAGDLFLCASSFVRDRVLAMGFPAARTQVHYIGVDCAAIRPRSAEEETPTILHVARLVEVKGAEYLVRALAALPARHARVDLVVIGDGPRRAMLEKLAGTLGLGARVRFLGALPHAEVLAWMRKAAMLALPSVRTRTGRVEGLGMVLLEAAACGVPAVGSRIGGIPEGILDGETGLLAPERNAAALAERMSALLDDRDLRARMGSAARRHIERRFDLRRQTETLEGFYDAVLSGRE